MSEHKDEVEETPVDVEAEAPADEEKAEPKHHEKHEAKPAKGPKGPKGFWLWLKAKPIRMVGAIVLTVLVLGGTAVGATDLRYPVFGTVLTTSIEVTVTDASTKQPVPKALVDFGGVGDLTDKAGKVTLKKVKLGHGDLKVRKAGYSDSTTKATGPVIGKGKAAVAIKPNGIKLVTQVANTITGGSVEGVEVKSGEASAISDETGVAEISLPPATNNTTQKLTFSKDGFNTKDVETAVKIGAPPLAVKLTPAGKVYFQSNRTGRIDIYGANLDGTGAEVVLAGTGQENTETGILPSIKNPNVMAIVSTRDGRRGGSLHSDLFIFDAQTRKLTKIEQDVNFYNYRAWVGNTLAYTKPKGQYGGCADIKTYDATNAKVSTFFNGSQGDAGCPTITLALRDAFLYSVRESGDANRLGVFLAKLPGSPKRLSSTYSDNTVRRAKQTFLSVYYNYNYGGGNSPLWDSIDLGSFAVTRVPNGPSIEASRFYNDSPDGSRSSFIEQRDGKSELYLTDGNGGNEKPLTSAGSVNQFVQWYGDDYIVYSVTRPGENALYVVSTDGGAAVKISDFYIGNQRTYGGGGNPY